MSHYSSSRSFEANAMAQRGSSVLGTELKGIPHLELRVRQLGEEEAALHEKLADLKTQLFSTDAAIRDIKKEREAALASLISLKGVSEEATEETRFSDAVVDELISMPSDEALVKFRDRARSAGLGSRHCQRLQDFVFQLERPMANASPKNLESDFKFRLVSTIRDCVLRFRSKAEP